MQADLRAFHYYGRHGCTVFAALTAQNPFGVSAMHAVPADFVAAQLDAVLGVYDIGAVKTGMLADPAAIEVIADRLAKHPGIAKVIDPVMVATSGVRLVSEETVEKIKDLLLPLATLITPNLPVARSARKGAGARGGGTRRLRCMRGGGGSAASRAPVAARAVRWTVHGLDLARRKLEGPHRGI